MQLKQPSFKICPSPNFAMQVSILIMCFEMHMLGEVKYKNAFYQRKQALQKCVYWTRNAWGGMYIRRNLHNNADEFSPEHCLEPKSRETEMGRFAWMRHSSDSRSTLGQSQAVSVCVCVLGEETHTKSCADPEVCGLAAGTICLSYLPPSI